MRQQYQPVFLLLLIFISGYQTQTTTPIPTVSLPDWNGDPNLCTVNPPVTPSPLPPPPFPKFSPQAEFTIERVEVTRLLNQTVGRQLTLYQYLYDYNANSMIIVKNANGFIDAEYYYYNKLKKSTYFRGDFCVVTDIPVNNPMDGASATQFPNGTWHIRPLNEFFLFSSNDPIQPVTPVYIGNDTIRGIPVDKWQSCYINKTEFRTIRRIWHFARQGYNMTTGPVGEYAVPIHAVISGSFSLPNGTQVAELDEIYHVHAYRRGILETSDALSPPKGVFCDSGPGQELLSLSNVSIRWPNRFSVRVEASSSNSLGWRRFHLRYDQGREGGQRRIRYDYEPPGSEDFESVIHDYGDNLTYVIDRRVGTCKISRGVDIADTNPIRDPIRFFIKHEAYFIFSPPENAWEFNGFRKCRGNSITCTILTTQLKKFPNIVDFETSIPTGETWEATNVEYGWSTRAPFANRPPNAPRFDYPVSLYLKMFRFTDPLSPSPTNIRTEDIEYEFYETSHERNPYDFDISLCYRSLQYDYLHVTMTLKPNRENILDNNILNRRRFEDFLHFNLINRMGIKFSRVADLEIEHETVSNEVTVFFTILGQTVRPESPSGFADEELKAAQALDALKTIVNNGQFQFNATLEDDSIVIFRGVQNSLKDSKLYMSTHARGQQVITKQYTSGSQAVAVIIGLLVGLIAGAIIIAVIRIALKQPMPAVPTSMRNPLPTINFQSKKSAEPSSTNA